VRFAQQVTKQTQRRFQIVGDHRPRKRQMGDADTLVPLHAKIIESVRQLAAVAAAGTARQHLAQHSRCGVLAWRIEHAAGGQQHAEGGASHPRHRLDDHDEAVCEGFRLNRLVGHTLLQIGCEV
jgi:hypothetical protein